MSKSNVHVLGEFAVPIPLYCFHCERKLPKRTEVEVVGKNVTAHCPHCRCMTPFRLGNSAEPLALSTLNLGEKLLVALKSEAEW